MAKEPEVVYSQHALAQMEADPKLKEAMKDIAATLRQAMHGVETGQYADFSDAMFALTGQRPEYLGPPDEDAEEGIHIMSTSFNDDDTK